MSVKRECPSCATEIPADQERCFVCGYEFAGKSSTRSRKAIIVVIVLLMMFLIPLVRMILEMLK